MTKDDIIQFLSDHKAEFERTFGVKKIGFFGSYARDENQTDSDIDIVVELNNPDMLSLIGLKQKIEEHLQLDVDIVRYRERMNRTLKNRIDRDALYV